MVETGRVGDLARVESIDSGKPPPPMEELVHLLPVALPELVLAIPQRHVPPITDGHAPELVT